MWQNSSAFQICSTSPSPALNSLGQTKNVELIRADAFVDYHFYGMPPNVVVVIVVFYVIVVVVVIAVVVVFVETF